MTVRTAFLFTLLVLPTLPSMASEVKITVSGVGFIAGGDVASARDRAIRDAQVRALEKALGVVVDARVALHKSLLIDDTLVTRTKGVIRNYQVLSEGREQHGLYRVTLEATVDRVAMADELVRLAGEKRVLMVRGSNGHDRDKGDKILLGGLAEAFSSAGFKISQIPLPEEDFLVPDSEKTRKLAEKTGNDLVVRLKLESSESQCPTKNFCACRANGFVRLYEGKAGSQLVSEKVEDVRGFGNTPDIARGDALEKGARALVDGMMGQLFFPREREVKVAVRNIPDYDAYKTLQRILATFRWVRAAKSDQVGYHPVKSVFLVRFAQDPDIFAGMLHKLGGYRFAGRSGAVFSLETE